MVCSGTYPLRPGAVHAPRISSVDFRRPRLHRFRRARPRQGQRHDRHGARAARTRSDERAGRGDRGSDALQHFRGPDEDQRGFLGHAPPRRLMDFLARPQDADLQAQAERQVPGRRAFLLEGRQVLLRALRGEGFDQQGQGLLRIDPVDRHARPEYGRAQFQGPELRGAVSPRHGNGCHHRREERGGRSDEPGRHRALQTVVLDQGRVDHSRQMGRLSRTGKDSARARDLSLHF